MLQIRVDDPDRLVLGISTWHERFALLAVGLGILTLGLAGLTLSDDSGLEFSADLGMSWLQTIVPLALFGGAMLAYQRHYVFDIPQRTLLILRGLRGTLRVPFSSIAPPEVIRGDRGAVLVLTRDTGEKLLTTSGPLEGLQNLRWRIHDAMKRGLQMEPGAPDAEPPLARRPRRR
ncbi:MAG: hypothetical protein M5U26_16085 [Planctomycetota bacterium]|nr:hypothetical protein [Planctomycetota bacterium]